MIKNYCDSCGTEIKRGNLNSLKLFGYSLKGLGLDYDLCPECAKVMQEVIKKWLKGDLK